MKSAVATIVLVVAALVAIVVYRLRHPIIAAVLIAAVLVAVLVLIIVVRAVVRFVWASPAARRNYPRMIRARIRWRWLTRNTGLAYIDPHAKSKIRNAFGPSIGTGVRIEKSKANVNYPRARFRVTEHGLVVKVRTTPKVGRKEVEKQAEHLANSWGVRRVSVSQPRPGRLVLHGHVVDPLWEPLTSAQVPPSAFDGSDLTRLYVGRDETGAHRFLPLPGTTCITVSGIPGAGKSTCINSLLMQWAPSPVVQFNTADGKNADSFEPWRDRALRTCGDDREEVADMLLDEVTEMKRRLRTVYDVLGVRNAWHVGPTEAMPLRITCLDEIQRWLDLVAVKNDKQAEKEVMQCRTLVQEIVRLGRSALMLMVLSTQRPTVDSIPGSIRDNAALSMAFALRTVDGSVAALGSEIRSYDSFMPTSLQGPEYVGCAVTTLRTGMDPFTKIRCPYFTEQEIEARAMVTAPNRVLVSA